MKLFKLSILTMLMISMPLLLSSQEEKSYQAYWIHEDRVKPGMTDEYEQISKDLVAACKEHNVTETKWLAMALNDNSYLYVSPVDKMADLDIDGFATLSEKMGKDKVSALFDRYNATYDEHGDYIVYLNKELSYMPGGVSQTVEGQNYRTLYYNYVTPENDKGFAETLKKIKGAFEKHNSKLHYRVYKTGFGVMGTYYMIAIAAENEQGGAKLGDENWEVMKDDFGPLLKELSKHTWKTDQKRGWMRNDLAYWPAE
ncbi:MAG: hypothetical protein JSV73_03645 [Flavobacteriaceae bacterium]|nr:MAG: hypothetical protein JSV73_03645 [Flavobacteriaceae bacterium]